MAIVDLVMPKLGESIMEATILKWHKKPGDKVDNDETVLDIATDKVDSEVPSTASGVITELLYSENDVVPIGATIARISTNGEETGNTATESEEDIPEDIDIPYVPQPKPALPKTGENINRFYSPLVLNIANSEGIRMSELETIPGTGADNRVTKNDILAYVKNRAAATKTKTQQPQPTERLQQPQVANQVQQQPQPSQPVQPPPQTEKAPVTNEEASATAHSYSGNVEIIEMDRMRKLIARHMTESRRTSAHVTSFAEADVTQMALWRSKHKADFEQREGARLTFTPLLISCLINAIKKFPIVNSSVDGDNIIIKKDINIGMATALPSGNLIVPVLRNADYMNLGGLTKIVNTLANNARNNKLRPDDTKEGTFTFTNIGSFGSIMGTPIINQPQVAILAAGAIKKRAVVIETEQGDTIGIRQMMYLSLSYDHRIIDGMAGTAFLAEVVSQIENWNENTPL